MKSFDSILLASGNRNKFLELEAVASEFGLRILSLDELSEERGVSAVPEVDETGATFYENAFLKAKAYCEWSNCPSLGDDSGLEVDALEGRPGVLSARYAGPDASQEQLIEKVIHELESLEMDSGRSVDRGACFCCSLVLYVPGGRIFSSEFRQRGRILEKPRGDGGFGYDPIVLIDDLEKTLAEVDFQTTCLYGFRGSAARRLFSEIRSWQQSTVFT